LLTKFKKMIRSSLTPWERRTSMAFRHDPPVAEVSAMVR
jgi:hypothetical protein